MLKKNAHCSYCGHAFPEGLAWPRTCPGCQNISYLNPLPVSVVLVPVDAGLLVIRRAIPPRIGQLALPGGFINMGESWQAAGAREVFEETGLSLRAEEIRDFRVLSAPDGTVLVFGLAAPRTRADLPAFVPTSETSEVLVIDGPTELCFPLHTAVANEFFQRQRAT